MGNDDMTGALDAREGFKAGNPEQAGSSRCSDYHPPASRPHLLGQSLDPPRIVRHRELKRQSARGVTCGVCMTTLLTLFGLYNLPGLETENGLACDCVIVLELLAMLMPQGLESFGAKNWQISRALQVWRPLRSRFSVGCSPVRFPFSLFFIFIALFLLPS